MANLTPEDPDAFLDYPLMEIKYLINPVLCPVCKGHGGWNLAINCYKNYPKPYCHFRCHCSQCNGHGWVEANSSNATCIHLTKELTQEECHKRNINHFGMCYHVTECTKCGKISSYDSGD